MKKISAIILLFGISFFTNTLFAQEMSKDQMRIFQTDHVENIKKVFKKEDFTKCFMIKETPYNLFTLSAKFERLNVLHYLLSNKVDVNKSCNDITPLMYTAMYGLTDTAKILLKNGAKKDIKDNNGKTAKDYALENKHPETAEIL